jgi:hypothetical protein
MGAPCGRVMCDVTRTRLVREQRRLSAVVGAKWKTKPHKLGVMVTLNITTDDTHTEISVLICDQS